MLTCTKHANAIVVYLAGFMKDTPCCPVCRDTGTSSLRERELENEERGRDQIRSVMNERIKVLEDKTAFLYEEMTRKRPYCAMLSCPARIQEEMATGLK